MGNNLRILYIDPWCEFGTNIYRYSTGLFKGVSNYATVTTVIPYSCKSDEEKLSSSKCLFFKYSSKMKRTLFRKLVRGVEYIISYIKILYIAKKGEYDVIHIEWPLFYSVDSFFWKLLKRECKLFVFKAHNVLPHSSGNRYIKVFEKLYGIADVVLVHGTNIKNELLQYYPSCKDKIYIQKYGSNMRRDISFDCKTVEIELRERINRASKCYLFFGDIHRDKGVDRIVRIWKENFKNSNSLLIIAGRVDQFYPELTELKEYEGRFTESIIFINGYISDNDLNYLISNCDLVLLPYRKAYMSAVVFTCAEFKKTFLSTNFGSVEEYVNQNDEAFIVPNNDNELLRKLKIVDKEFSKQRLCEMGELLHEHFMKEYRWDEIGNKLVHYYSDCIIHNNRKEELEVSNQS